MSIQDQTGNTPQSTNGPDGIIYACGHYHKSGAEARDCWSTARLFNLRETNPLPEEEEEGASAPLPPPSPYDTQYICETAAHLVSGDRAASHGDTVQNHQCIADLWNGYIEAICRTRITETLHLTPLDIANMMEILKIARRLTGVHNIDDYIDGAGYAAVAGEIAERTLSPQT